MPKYRIVLTDGRTFDVEADKQPTEAEVMDQLGQQQAPEKPPGIGASFSGPDAAAVQGSAPGRFLSGAWQNVNPSPIVSAAQDVSSSRLQQAKDQYIQGNYLRAAGNLVSAGFPVPELIARMAVGAGKESLAQLGAAADAAGQGNYTGAAARTLAAIPLVGPAAADVAETYQSGDTAGALGKAVTLVGPDLLVGAARGGIPLPGVMKNRKADAAANVEWAIKPEQQVLGSGQPLPVDVATATGNPWVKGMQRAGGESIVGSTAVPVQQGRQQLVYEAEAARRAEQATGVNRPVTANEAGDFPVAESQKLTDTIKAQAQEHYSDAEMYSALAEPEWVPTKDKLTPARMARAEHSLGRAVSVEEVQELRRILNEMEVMPFTKHIFDEQGNFVRGGGRGSNVYEELWGNMPHSQRPDPTTGKVGWTVPDPPSRGEVIASLKRAIATGHFTNPAKGAMAVVAERMKPGSYAAARAELPPSAGELPPQQMQLPVDPKPVRDQFRSEYGRLMRVHELTNTPASPALRALIGFMEGPDQIPLQELIEADGKFKSIARAGKKVVDPKAHKSPEQRLAIQMSAAIDPLIKEKAAGVPGLLESLTTAREMYAQKFPVDMVLKELSGIKSGVSRFTQLSGPTGKELLQKVQETTPQAIPVIAKGKLDEINRLAFEYGAGGPLTAYKEFDAMEPETLQILFPTPGHANDLKQFYQIMARRAEHVNPSGSALLAMKPGEVVHLAHSAAKGSWLGAELSGVFGLAGIAGNNPRIARLLVQGASIPVKNKAAVAKWTALLNQAIQEQEQQKPPQ